MTERSSKSRKNEAEAQESREGTWKRDLVDTVKAMIKASLMPGPALGLPFYPAQELLAQDTTPPRLLDLHQH